MKNARILPKGILLTASCLTALALAPGQLRAQAAPQGDPFAGVSRLSKGATEVKDVNLDPDQLKSAAGMSGSDMGGMQQMEDVSVHKYEFPQAGIYDMAAVKQYADALRNGGWKPMVYKQENGELTEVATREINGGAEHEMAVLKAEPKELKFVYLRYKGQLAGMDGVPGVGADTPSH